MAYLNANIPVQYAQIKRSIYMTLENIKAKLKIVLSSVLPVLQAVLSYVMRLWGMASILSPAN